MLIDLSISKLMLGILSKFLTIAGRTMDLERKDTHHLERKRKRVMVKEKSKKIIRMLRTLRRFNSLKRRRRKKQ